MYGCKVYIKPEDILDRLSEEDKKRFNRCVFIDVSRQVDGTAEMTCLLFNESDEIINPSEYKDYRQNYFNGEIKVYS